MIVALGLTLTLTLSAMAAPQQVLLSDGQVLTGEVESLADGNYVLVLGDGKRLPLPAEAVASIGDPPAPGAGPPDANRSRYFYGPSAFSLGKGHGYLAQRALVLSSAGVGIVDGWDIEVGSVLPTLFIPGGFVGFVGTKVSGAVSERVRLMAGAQLVFADGSLPLSLGFGGVTVGDADRHLSVTTGPGLQFSGRWTQTQYTVDDQGERVTQQKVHPAQLNIGMWITSVSAVRRLGPRLAFVTENWVLVLPEGGPWGFSPLFVVPSGGVRLLANRYAIDLGVVPILAIDRGLPVIPVPWVSFDWAW